jgi:hypothetical protein
MQQKAAINISLIAGLSRFEFKFLFQFGLDTGRKKEQTKKMLEITRTHSYISRITVKPFHPESITLN